MSPVPTSRIAWLPGVIVLAAAFSVPVAAALLLGVRWWPAYLGLAVAALLLIGGMERLWARRSTPARPRARGKLKVLQGGKAAPYDLEKDSSTDNQRYLM
jgi:membrane protein implicated in regulation of membrane protease activity